MPNRRNILLALHENAINSGDSSLILACSAGVLESVKIRSRHLSLAQNYSVLTCAKGLHVTN